MTDNEEIHAYFKLWPDNIARQMEMALKLKFPQIKGLDVEWAGEDNYSVTATDFSGVTEQQILDAVEEIKNYKP